MPWCLQTDEGTARRRIDVRPARPVTIGRANTADVQFEDDPGMSNIHFVVMVSAGSLLLQNLSATSGTEVNGQRIDMVILQPGDKVKAGETLFAVVGSPASPYPAQVRIGGWGFKVIPEGWQVDGSLGFHFSGPDPFRPNITAVEEPLPSAQTLAAYVQTQVDLARGRIAGISFSNPAGLKMPGPDEALIVTISVPQPNGLPIIQRQVYALSSGIVGILTVTVLESDPHPMGWSAIIGGLSYFQD